MNQQMGWEHVNPYEYHFERGLYYHEVDRNLICGSQPRNPDDVHQLKVTENVTTILNLQQDKDLAYWNVDGERIRRKCKELGINFVRRPAKDFDPHSLRKTIPSAVQVIHETLASNGRVYVHCTAGLGRAPAVCIAFLYWFRSMGLDDAYQHLTSLRPCGPKRDAIRGATFDLLANESFDAFERLSSSAYATLNDEDRYALQYRVLKELRA
jgi:protein-tyrosine phosphatase